MKDQIVDMLEMSHPWQPEWVVTSEDVDKYLKVYPFRTYGTKRVNLIRETFG